MADAAAVMKRGENLRKHGLSGTPEHRAWCGMMTRCYWSQPGDRNFALYQGAGITVAEPWHSFLNFLNDIGAKPSPKHSLDRFPNPAGNYERGNVRWATAKEQANNWATRNRRLTFGGETLSLDAWASRLDIRRESLRDRLDSGWSIERALTVPAIRRRVRGNDGRFVNA